MLFSGIFPQGKYRMNNAELEKILQQIEKELTGDPEHDAGILDAWADRYRGVPEAEPLLDAISRHMVSLFMEEEGNMPELVYEDMVATADDDYREACELINAGNYDEALQKLLVLTAVVRTYPLPEDKIWTDLTSYQDYLLFMEYFRENIRDREIARHPMRPADFLFTCGRLLIELDRPGEALEPLMMLNALDPVCPRYLFELGEAYKRTGMTDDARETALWALHCASNPKDLSRAYRDLGYCLIESENYRDAVIMYLLSLRFHSTRQAETEIFWIRKNAGISPETISEEMITRRCEELDVPIGISDTVRAIVDYIKSQKDDGEA